MSSTVNTERRQDIRLAGRGEVDAAVIDANGYPVARLEDARVVNVSAGGLALTTTTQAQPGSLVHLATEPKQSERRPRQKPVALQALECAADRSGRYTIRCRLTSGRLPAELIYNW